MHGKPGVRTARQERARAARVVQMYVSEDDVIDALGRNTPGRKRIQHARHGGRGGAIHDHRAAVLDDQVHRRLHLAVVDRVHRDNAVLVVKDAFHRRIIEFAS